jgi:ABC-type arginine/histidine transport system permease subunit
MLDLEGYGWLLWEGAQLTSLVSIITVMDLTGIARVIASRNFAFYEAFITAAVFYLAIVYLFLFFARRIEGRLHAHLEPARGGGNRVGGH